MKTSTVNDAPAVKAAQPRLAAWARRGLPVLAALALVGCASGPRSNPDDPFESYNRSMTRFNDDVDAAILKPVATAYVEVTPTPVRTGVASRCPWLSVSTEACSFHLVSTVSTVSSAQLVQSPSQARLKRAKVMPAASPFSYSTP